MDAAVRNADRGDDQGQTDDVERTLRQQDEVEEGLRVLEAHAAEAGQLVGVDLVRDDGGEGERGGSAPPEGVAHADEAAEVLVPPPQRRQQPIRRRHLLRRIIIHSYFP